MRSNPIGQCASPTARDDRSSVLAISAAQLEGTESASKLSKRHRRLRGSTYNKRIGRWKYRE
jgi:hypothetical protein